MIAARLSAVWQVGLIAGAALGCYLVSQSVAGERAALARADRQIADTKEDIRRLSTEIGARSRMAQLERWNGTFKLAAPRAPQFVANAVQLASLYGHAGRNPLPIDPAIAAGRGAIDKVSFTPAPPPAAPAPSMTSEPHDAPAPQPLLRVATYVRARPTAFAPDALPVVRAALHTESSAPAHASLLPDDIGALAAREKAPAARSTR